MKVRKDFFQAAMLVLLSGISLFLIGSTFSIPSRNTFLIEDNSELFIEGSSNVNRFTCHCMQDFNQQPFVNSLVDNGQGIEFSATSLKIQSQKLDCQNRKMNSDMHKTLLAEDHPFIEVQLLKVETIDGGKITDLDDWSELKADAVITIAKVSKKVTLTVKGRQVSPARFQFVSSKALLMSDFQLVPPSPLMGLIKVNDRIDINFDLLVKIQEV